MATADPAKRRVKLNVGGQIFETTAQTLKTVGESTALYKTVHPNGAGAEQAPVFIDRDPALFAQLLGLVRGSGTLGAAEWPQLRSQARGALIDEAVHYGISDAFQAALRPRPLAGADAERIAIVAGTGSDAVSSLCAGADASVWAGQGPCVVAFDWALRRQPPPVLTCLRRVHVLRRLGDHVAVVGSPEAVGLHLYDVAGGGVHVGSFSWTDPRDPRVFRAGVHALAVDGGGGGVYGSFESSNRVETAVVALDAATLAPVRELCRYSGGIGGGASLGAAPTVLEIVAGKGLLLAASVTAGAFGYSGYVRLLDPRAGPRAEMVWEWREPLPGVVSRVRDCLADVAVSEGLGALVKVGILSGDVAVADLRMLDAANPWVTLAESNPSLAQAEGCPDAKVVAHGREVFCGRGYDLEVWSEVRFTAETEKGLSDSESCFRRNLLEHSRRHGGSRITALAAGGDRLFAARSDLQGVEVWESRSLP